MKRFGAFVLSLFIFIAFCSCSTSEPKTQANPILERLLKNAADSSKFTVRVRKAPELLNKRYFYRTIEYPKKCMEAGTEGTVYVSFTVTKTGETKDFEVVQGIGYWCNRGAVKHIKRYAEFSPGMINGQPVSVRYTLPIVYRLR